MTAVYDRPPKTGEPRITTHLEVETEACVCPRLRCGGVMYADLSCDEHGVYSGPMVKIHTHAVQSDKIIVGTYIP